MPLTIKELEKSDNIADLLDEEQLTAISKQVIEGYELDLESLGEWRETVDHAMDIAKQTLDKKNFPFQDASNIKYPLLTQAAIDFASREYPQIIQNDRIVKGKIIGRDDEGEKLSRLFRVTKFMSHQLLVDSVDWEDGLDKMLHMLPIVGSIFRKTYYHPLKRKIVTEVCNPTKIVINYNASSLEDARRITHELDFNKNDVIERIRSGIYSDVSLEGLTDTDDENADDDDYTLLLEQHCFLDLDDDGYKEPYIVTLHRESQQVLRIVARFASVETNSSKVIVRIEPEHYFTDYHF